MDENEDLTLNIFSPVNEKNVSEKVKENIWGNRRERIKARKLSKLKAKAQEQSNKKKKLSTNDEHIDSTFQNDTAASIKASGFTNDKTNKVEGNLFGLNKKRKLDGLEHTAAKKLKQDGAHFSSLFNCNPEIPTINAEQVESIKEEVFSANSFESLSLDTYMLRNLRDNMKFNKMTNVQQQAIPSILKGIDALVKSQTGTGKTLAYAIPIIHTLQSIRPKIKRADGVFAIVIVPTRELALQSYETFQKLVKPYQWIVPGYTIGGEKRKAEKARVRKGINVLLGTPGRLADHVLHTQSLQLAKLRYLIIDEADRLFDMGFEKDVRLIIDIIKEKAVAKQTVLLSATLSDGVEKLAGMSLVNPLRIDASQEETTDGVTRNSDTENISTGNENSERCDTFSVPEKLKQLFLVTPCKLRLVSLIGFIADKCVLANQKSKIIVFLSTQDSVEFHYHLFSELFIKDNKAVSDVQTLLTDQNSTQSKLTSKPLIRFYKLHGNMEQKNRTQTFMKFSSCPKGVLFCTDVAARGLHLHNIKWIVQYTTPADSKEYIHRVGRTARAGAQGNSLLFLMPSETEYIKTLNSIKISMKEISMRNVLQNLLLLLDSLPQILEADRRPPRTYEEAATTFQVYIEKNVHDSPEMQELAKKAFQSFVRGYSTYPKHLKSIFHVKYLHLGHLAKSFGLRDAPGGFSGNSSNKKQSSKNSASKKKTLEKEHPKLDFYNPKSSTKKSARMSEFSSGLSFWIFYYLIVYIIITGLFNTFLFIYSLNFLRYMLQPVVLECHSAHYCDQYLHLCCFYPNINTFIML